MSNVISTFLEMFSDYKFSIEDAKNLVNKIDFNKIKNWNSKIQDLIRYYPCISFNSKLAKIKISKKRN